ncbi:hypothetical protein Tco_0743022 [Tanacetum coccineum]
MVPRAVLMKTGLKNVNNAKPLNTVRSVNTARPFSTARSVNTVRPYYTAHPKSTVSCARPKTHFQNQAQSTVQRPFYKSTALTKRSNNQNINTGRQTVNTVRPNVNTVRARGFNASNSQLNDKGFVDSGCSRHMSGNIAHLLDFKDFDGGYVTFGGGANGGRITGKEKSNKATINGHSLSITEGSLWRHLKLADQDGITSIPTTEIFEQLALIGYHTNSDKLTFQKGAFLPQWRFLIHHILHCLSPKKTAWEQFSSNIAAAIICLATNRKFNFSRMIFEHMVSNISSPHKFLMYPRFIQICLDMQRHHLQQHTRIYHVPSLSMKVFSNMKRSTKGFSGQEVALFPNMLDVTEPSSSPSPTPSQSPEPTPTHTPTPTQSSPT